MALETTTIISMEFAIPSPEVLKMTNMDDFDGVSIMTNCGKLVLTKLEKYVIYDNGTTCGGGIRTKLVKFSELKTFISDE